MLGGKVNSAQEGAKSFVFWLAVVFGGGLGALALYKLFGHLL